MGNAHDTISRHAFVSYVRENQNIVDRLCMELTTRGVSVWLDRKEIKPGSRWKDAIRLAISTGAFFLACFSKEYVQKDRSVMNEELILAIDELRLRPTDRTWFIPVRLNESPIPDRSIGGGEHLSDLQWVDLSENWDVGIELLVSVLLPIRHKYLLMYETAFEKVVTHFSKKSTNFLKTKYLRIAILGRTGVGKSTLIRSLIGERGAPRSESFLYDDMVREYYWPDVGYIIDIPALGDSLKAKENAIELLNSTADLALYVITASMRIQMDDVDGISTLLHCNIPCIAIINKIDYLDMEREEKVLSYVRERTGCPVVSLAALTGTNVDLLRMFIQKSSALTKSRPYGL